MKNIQIINICNQQYTKPGLDNLPDEDAYELVAQLQERAKASSQAFNLVTLNWSKHPRGLCIGKTATESPICVFYITEYGDYAWIEESRLSVVPDLNHTRHFIQRPVEVGMHYWFQKGSDLLSSSHIKAVPVGIVGPLANAYKERHAVVAKPADDKHKKKKTTDSISYIHPPPEVLQDDADFQPLKSLDELGL